ncbi:MAG: EAL domain-containing protein [Burkholderiales bacterium]|nr:EAL domain-containing protein [Burkholderiales bacterium]
MPGAAPGSAEARRPLLVAGAFAAALLCSALVAWRLDLHQAEENRARTLDMAGDHAHALQAGIEHNLSATFALAAMIRQGNGALRDFESLAAEMLPYYPGASALQLAPGGVVTQVHPLRGNEQAIGHDLLRDPARTREAFAARDSGELTLAGPFRLAQGGLGAAGRLPVFLPDATGKLAFWGFAIVLMRFPDALAPARLDHLADLGYRYELWRRNPESGEREVLAVSAAGPPSDPVERTLEVPNATWTLAVAPLGGWSSPARRAAMAGAALALSLLVAYLARLMLELQAHRRGLESLVARRTAEVKAREADLERAQAVARIGSWVTTDGRTFKGSPEAYRIFGIPGDAPVDVEAIMARIHPEDREGVLRARERVLGGSPCAVEFRLVADDGVRWVHGQAERVDGEDGAPPRIVSTMQDITERKQVESDLRLAAAAFEAKEGMIVTDARGVILRMNRACTEITGYSAEEAVGQTPRLFKSGRQDEAFYRAMWDSVNRTGSWHGEIWNRRKNGEIYPESLRITAVRNEAGVVTNYIGTLADITQRKQAEAEIERLAFYDALTGLPNRRLLNDRLRHALAASARSRRTGALLFIDLDDFKTLNDTRGHDVGDELLRQVATRLAGCVRKGDTVARLGGDEYVVMLEEVAESARETAARVEQVGETVLARIGVPYALPSGAHHQAASIGIVLFGDRAETPEDLLRHADLAMYRAKAAGGNALRFFDPEMQGAVNARAGMVADLRAGLEQGEFRLAYQPQVDREGRLLGAEALLRWSSPGRGSVAPDAFIPLAEETGLIVPLGNLVVATACEQLVRWADEPRTVGLTLAVNVSAREFRHPEFVERLVATLERTGADPRKLMLEFTESVLLDDFEGTVAKMIALRARGVSFALDDFGTGYSSLAYLKRLPVQQLKIDKSFVRDVLADPADATIARAIIALAQSVGLSVVAEGVETRAQWEFLAGHGCHAFQGYHFGAPGAAEDLLRGR